MTTDNTTQEQPTIYKSVALALAQSWRDRATRMIEPDSDETAAITAALVFCASQLEGLANL